MDSFPKSKPTASTSKPYSRPGPIPSTSSALSGKNRRINDRLFSKRGMKDPDNPVTNSTAYERALHIQSCATGHQSGRVHGNDKGWQAQRGTKLKEQAKLRENDIFKGVICYFNGYTGPRIGDLEIKQLVQRNGGQYRPNQSSACTHIIALTRLSGSKQQEYLNKTKQKQKVVHPDWILDSVDKGKRQKESDYSVISSDAQSSGTLFGLAKPARKHAAAYECPADIPQFGTTAPYRRNRTLKATFSEEIILTSSDEEGDAVREQLAAAKLVLEKAEETEEEEDEFAFPPCGQSGRMS